MNQLVICIHVKQKKKQKRNDDDNNNNKEKRYRNLQYIYNSAASLKTFRFLLNCKKYKVSIKPRNGY